MTLSRALIPDLGKLQAFESAARHGSVTQAGRELSLTQSTVSRQIGELERQLGVLLFERVRQRVVLSEAGRKFLPDARKLLQQGEAAMLRAMAGSKASLLRLATLPTFGARWLTPRLPGFLAAHPQVVLDIASRSEPFDLEEQGFDAAIHYGQPVWANATCRYVCQEVIVPVASPVLAGHAEPQTAETLAQLPLLHLATRPKAWSDWFALAGVETTASYQGHRFDQFAMVIEAASAGLGVALLPLYLIEQELQGGQLRVVVDRPLPTENGYHFVMPNGKLDQPAANALYRWIVSEVGGVPVDRPAA
ncbi:LysR substrate-binding domain-containing protein [Mesorhizobium marinum]|uniref:LysR substrate-binding domain-containing protein n=1 Tax=Mesorhizobium marinum TaxID=3228790 RepID=A0ABV3QXL9_9HYPH